MYFVDVSPCLQHKKLEKNSKKGRKKLENKHSGNPPGFASEKEKSKKSAQLRKKSYFCRVKMKKQL